MATLIQYNICDGELWSATQAVTFGDRRMTTTSKYLECIVAGTTSSAEPNPAIVGDAEVDGTVMWKHLCVQDYSIHSDLIADIGVGVSDTLVTDDITLEGIIWHKKNGAYNQTASGTFSFAETCDATHRIIFKPAPGDSWQEGIDPKNDPLRYDEDYGVAIETNGNVYAFSFGGNSEYCEVRDFQAKTVHNTAYGFSNHKYNTILEGCIAISTPGSASSRNLITSSRGITRSSIAIDDGSPMGTAIALTYDVQASNLLAVRVGTYAAGEKCISLGHTLMRALNCVAVGGEFGFVGDIPTFAECTGNVSWDGTAAVQFPTQGDQIINGTNLVKDYASIATLDCWPPASSSALAVNASELNFDYTARYDIMRTGRTLGVTNYRGPVIPKSYPTSAYANFGLMTGLNDGTSEANAWQTLPDMTNGLEILVATQSVLCHVTNTGSYTYNNNWTWTAVTSEAYSLELQGYENTPGDGGYCEFALSNFKYMRWNTEGMKTSNFSIHGNYNSVFATLTGDGGVVYNCRVFNESGTPLSVAEATVDNCYLYKGAGASTSPYTLYLNKGSATNNVIVNEGTEDDTVGVYVSLGYDIGLVQGNLIVHTGGAGDRGLSCLGGANITTCLVLNNNIIGFGTGIYVDEMDPIGAADHFDVLYNIFQDCTIGVKNDSPTYDAMMTVNYNAFYNVTTEVDSTIGTSIFQNITLVSEPFMNAYGVADLIFDPSNLDPRLTMAVGDSLLAQFGAKDGVHITNRIGLAGAA